MSEVPEEWERGYEDVPGMSRTDLMFLRMMNEGPMGTLLTASYAETHGLGIAGANLVTGGW